MSLQKALQNGQMCSQRRCFAGCLRSYQDQNSQNQVCVPGWFHSATRSRNGTEMWEAQKGIFLEKVISFFDKHDLKECPLGKQASKSVTRLDSGVRERVGKKNHRKIIGSGEEILFMALKGRRGRYRILENLKLEVLLTK